MRIWSRIFLTAASLLLPFSAKAQFSTGGNDPGNLKWNEVSTDNFRIIYPRGLDSLAFEYGKKLEMYRMPESWSSGMYSGKNYRSRMPVVLHAYTAESNGAVTWAPKRVDLFTVPDPSSPTPMPWDKVLAIHEGRHIAQMQFGRQGLFKPFHYLLGEMFAGAMAGVYPGPTILEGDAVATETALTRTGRGRQGDFLNYMMPAFDSGDYRDYWQWTYGSQRKYAPDYYRVGYLLVSGTRVLYDDPLFTKEYFDKVTRRPIGFGFLQRTVKKASGMKFRKTFRAIEEEYGRMWRDEAAQRAPFDNSVQVTARPRLHTSYGMTTFAGDEMFSIKSGLETTARLVRQTPDGKETVIRPFATGISRLQYDPYRDRIYWTEKTGGRRWTLQSTSRIRYIETSAPQKIHTLTTEGKYFNSVPSPDGERVAAIEYPVSGGSRLVVLGTEDGAVEKTFTAPDSVQFTELAWLGERLFVSGLSDEGFSLFEVTGKDGKGKALLRKLVGPQPVVVDNLCSIDGRIGFVSDRTGVGEFYVLDPDNGRLLQMTSTRYGLRSVAFKSAADTLYYSSVAASDNPETYRQGQMVYSIAIDDLHPKEVSFDDIHSYPIADALSQQDMKLSEGSYGNAVEATFTEPRRYGKLRLPHIHSWAPIYFDYDNIRSLSSDEIYESTTLGATVMFQNLLGTGYGTAGYSYHENLYGEGDWRHSGHIDYTFTGWYPVFELTADFNDRDQMVSQRAQVTDENNKTYISTTRKFGSKPYAEGNLSVYVPLRFSSGGWSRGLVPQVKYGISNDIYNDDISVQKVEVDELGNKTTKEVSTIEVGNEAITHRLTFSLRGYSVQPTAPSAIFPRVGIGAEAGFRFRPGHTEAYAPAVYGYAYGYLPGLMKTHGIKLTATWQKQIYDDSFWCFGENIVVTRPRGFSSSNLTSILSHYADTQTKLSFDYAIPIASPFRGSLLSPLAYIKRLEVTPFADLSTAGFRDDWIRRTKLSVSSASFLSVGADICVNLSNIAWIPYGCTAGVRTSYNYCSNMSAMESIGLKGLDGVSFEFLFTTEL